MTPMAFTDVGHYKVYESAQAAIATMYNVRDVGDSLALSFSKVASALAGGGMTVRNITMAQKRENRIVARVPKAPLFLLITLNLLFAALGMVLATLALSFSKGAIWDVTVPRQKFAFWSRSSRVTPSNLFLPPFSSHNASPTTR